MISVILEVLRSYVKGAVNRVRVEPGVIKQIKNVTATAGHPKVTPLWTWTAFITSMATRACVPGYDYLT